MPTIAQFFADHDVPYVADPQVSGALAVFPLVGGSGPLTYLSFAQALKRGATITERPQGASVNDLVVTNPTDLPVLLFEGEEVLGAQQNRTFDVSVLVAAKSQIEVPVSCVEHGRWDGRRHHEPFAPAPQAAHPTLRSMKNAQAAMARAGGGEARADQGAVWNHIEQIGAQHGSAAPTQALHDVFASQDDRLKALTDPIEQVCSQTGMIVAIGGRFTVLDRISEPEALAGLFDPLVRGYALDALNAPADASPPTLGQARGHLERVLAMQIEEHDGRGLGREIRATGANVRGAGVAVGDELVALSVFSA